MSGKTGRDGIRGLPGLRTVYGSSHSLRVTATAKLSANETEALAQRTKIVKAIATLKEVLAEQGIKLEYVVGKPRSPEMLQASLIALADAGADLIEATV